MVATSRRAGRACNMRIPMSAASTGRSLIARLRGARRVAALVLVWLVGGVAASVACASHDLADAGFTAAGHVAVADHASPDSHPGTDGGDSGPTDLHCCHAAGHHVVAVLTSHGFDVAADRIRIERPTSAVLVTRFVHPELRPPIL